MLARLGPGQGVAAACVLAGTLLALVALAARGYRPVSGDEPSREPSAQFIDFFFTGAAILWALGAVLLVFLWTGQARRDPQTLRIRIGLPGFLLLVGVVLFFAFGPALLERFQAGGDDVGAQTGTTQTRTGDLDRPDRRRSPEFEWPLVVAVGVGLLIGAGILAFRRPRRHPEREELAQALAEELDDTIDDLRRERDARRAVIAAYARMERILGAHGVPRRPSEAPIEYLERVLLELEAGERPVATLTGLFQEAKFSEHELDLAARDRAVDALVEIRDDLRTIA